MKSKWKKLPVVLIGIIAIAVCGCSNDLQELNQKRSSAAKENTESTETVRTGTWETAAQTPYGAYPELVTYTLGQMSGANNSNLPDGNTYDDNAYTRYLRKILNIQNKSVYMEREDRYDEFVNILVKDQTLPDVLVVSDRETLKELVDNDLVEDLSEVYENCTSERIKEMFESYGSGLLDSVRFNGKLMAIPETVTDHGPRLMWLRNKYVVVRKGYEHPEIVMKIISVLFDYSRYEAKDADEVNDYFALNVEPTARPLVINVDYNEATFQITKDIQSVMSDMRKEESLSAIEKSYYDAAEKFIQGKSETAEDWAAYESRLAAVGRLIEGNYRSTAKRYLDDADGEIPKSLQQLEKDTFIQIIMGVKPITYFDTFVQEWYEQGGEELTEQIRRSNPGE